VIVPARIVALLRKEIAELTRNRAALLPVVVVGVISTALPFLVAIVLPAMSGRPLAGDTDLADALAKVAGELPGLGTLTHEEIDATIPLEEVDLIHITDVIEMQRLLQLAVTEIERLYLILGATE